MDEQRQTNVPFNWTLMEAVVAMVFLFLLVASYSFSGKTSDEFLDKSNQVAKNDPKLQDLGIQSIIKDTETYIISAHYPTTKNNKINKEIEIFIDKYISVFLDDIAGSELSKYNHIRPEFLIDYEVFRMSKSIVSFKFTITSIKNGARTDKTATKSFNLRDGTTLLLKDIFQEGYNYEDFLTKKISQSLVSSKYGFGAVNKDAFLSNFRYILNNNNEHFVLARDSLFVFIPDIDNVSEGSDTIAVEVTFEEINQALSDTIVGVKEDISEAIPSEIESVENYPAPKARTRQIDHSKKLVAFTFDDGPADDLTEKTLNILKAKGVVATFYLIGGKAQYYPKLLRRMISEGHEIGNHTWNHPFLSNQTSDEIREQINKTQNIIKKFTGVTPRTMRPPFGDIDARVAKQLTLPAIMWSVDSEDWKSKNSKTIKNRVYKMTRNGYIVLFHDTGPWTVAVIDKIIDEFIAGGYEFVTVSELLGFIDEPANAVPGARYYGL